jgi:hypothetical protein
MGYVMAMGPCCVCARVFGYNPHKVPSVRIAGVREPVCKECIYHANILRVARKEPIIEILPGAYEAMDEEEL